jgi:hypothetical protein
LKQQRKSNRKLTKEFVTHKGKIQNSVKKEPIIPKQK